MRRPLPFAIARLERSRAGSIVRASGCRSASPSTGRTTSVRMIRRAQFFLRADAANQRFKLRAGAAAAREFDVLLIPLNMPPERRAPSKATPQRRFEVLELS